MIDGLDQLVEPLQTIADLVICDASYSGKLELLKMVELCQESGVTYVMIHCGPREYQLADIYENAAMNYQGQPKFGELLSLVGRKIAAKT